MAAKYEIDEKLFVPAKVVQINTDETGTVYQVKMIAQEKVITQFFEEDELIEIVDKPAEQSSSAEQSGDEATEQP